MKILKVAFIEILIVIFFLGLVEVAAHFYFFLKNGYAFEESFLYDNDAQLIYKINENYKGKHGSFYLGMREDFFEREKGDKVRIVCLGASTTFGHKQFENSKVWPYLLEQLMGDERYEVLNAGVPGYGSSNLAARLKKEILIDSSASVRVLFK